MKLYLIQRIDKVEIDECDEAVVRANNVNHAKGVVSELYGMTFSNTTVEFLGIAKRNSKAGVVSYSYLTL